jgi:O-antigen/teichoic acid export membrane protein
MQNNKSLSGSTIWYSAGNFVVRSISFILLPLYSHLISTGDFGIYSLLMSFYAIAAVLFQSGMQNALMKYYLEHDDIELRKKIFSSIINSIGIFGFLITFVGVLFSKEISGLLLGSSQYSNLTALLLITLLVDTLGYFGLYLLKTQEKAKKVVNYSVAGAFVNLTLNIVFIYSIKIGVAGIFLAQIISSLFLLVFLLKDILPEYKLTIDTGFIRTAFIFSLPIILGGFMSSAVDVCDRFFLNIYTDKNIVGIYSLSYKIAMVMNVFIISFRTAWIPHAINLSKSSDTAEVFGKTFMKLLSAGFLILLAVTLFAPFLFNVKFFGSYLFDKTYEPGLVILPYVLLGYLFNGIIGYYSLYPFISNKTYHFLISDGSAFIINIILNIILIPIMGMLGAAVATTAAFLASAIYLYMISRKKVNIVYPQKEILLITFITAIVFIAGMISRSFYLAIILIAVYIYIVNRLTKIKLTGLLSIN